MHAGLSNALSATFLALLVACLGRVLARRPAILHCLWLLVLLKLVTPPLYEIPISWPETLSASQKATSAGASGAGGASIYLDVVGSLEPVALNDLEAETADLRLAAMEDCPVEGIVDAAIARSLEWLSLHWAPIVAVIWLTGTLATLLISVRRVFRFQLLLREAQPASEEVQDWVDRLAVSLGIDRLPQAWWISGKLSPMLWALGGCPRLIIPIDLWKSLDQRQRGTLLVHELAHLRRGDHRVRIFELVVTALYWWNPVLWWARQALRDVEEQCCDAWVVWAFPEAAKSYAETLLETLDFLNQSELSEPLLASGFGKVHHLRRRLTMIMNGTTPRLVSLWGALGALSLGALLLPVNATWAQKPGDNKDVRVIVVTEDDPKKAVDLAGTVDVHGDIGLADDVVLYSADAKPGEVSVVVNTDDASVSVSADSFEDAIKKINEQIQALAKQKTPLGDKEKAQQKALLQIAKQLEQLAKNNEGLKSASGKSKGDEKVKTHVMIRKVEVGDAPTVSPEKKAQIEKARARISELSKALAAAQLDLAKLEGHGAHGVTLFTTPDHKSQVRYRVEQPKIAHDNLNVFIRRKVEADAAAAKAQVKKVDPKQVLRELTIGTDDGMVPNHELRVFKRSADRPADEDRIQALEKKLNKLLEEVASLKKERSK